MEETTKKRALIGLGALGIVGGTVAALRYKKAQDAKALGASTTKPQGTTPQVSPTSPSVPGSSSSNATPGLPAPPIPAPSLVIPPASIPAVPTTPLLPSAIPGVGPGSYAVVTTNDPAPAGDLAIRVAPNLSAAQVPGGGAEKDGLVLVINPNASTAEPGVWAEVQWPGGSRRPAARGFARTAFLKAAGLPSAPSGTLVQPPVVPVLVIPPVAPAVTSATRAIVTTNDPAPSGDLYIRSAPSMSGTVIGGADKSGEVTILEAESSKTEPGVWAKIQWGGGRNAPATGYSKKAYLKLL